MSKPRDPAENGTVWVLIGLDEKVARRQGLPPQLPVPQAEFEGLADQGLAIDKARGWVKAFLTTSPLGQDGTWRRRHSALVTSLESFVDNAPLWDKAQKAFAEHDFAAASKVLKRITIMNDQDHAAKFNLASAQANLGDDDGALKNFKAIRSTFEGDPEYHVAVGQVYLRNKDTDNALNEMVLALEAKPDCQPALDALVQLGVLHPIYEDPRDASSLTYVRADAVVSYLLACWNKQPRDVAFYLDQLAYHEREGRHEVTLVAAEHAVKAGHAEAELSRIAALRALGRAAESLHAAERYAAAFPGATAQVELAKSLAAMDRPELSAQATARALEIDPGDLTALNLRFWPADPGDIRSIHEAIPALQAFAEAHPNAAGTWRTLARAFLATGRIDEALEGFVRALGLTPADDALRAEYWSELGRHQRYDVLLQEAATLGNMAQRDWKLRWNEAEAYAGLGKRVEARAAFSAINFDDRLHVDIRKRAKRAVASIDEAPSPQAG